MNGIELSIVLPTYKERNNLAVLIPQIEKIFQEIPFEIIIVDDNSQDGTSDLIADFKKQFTNIKYIKRAGLLGIGSALREGYNEARGEYILSSDADLSFVVTDMLSLYKKIQEGYDIVLGYKVGYKPLASINIEKNTLSMYIQYSISKNISHICNWIVSKFSGIDKLKDFNTNFRILRRGKWLQLKTIENTNFFLFETILRAKKTGFSIIQIPVIFYDRKFGESKINFLTEAPHYFIKLIRYSFFS